MYRNDCVFHRLLKTWLPTSQIVVLQFIFIYVAINILLYQVIFLSFFNIEYETNSKLFTTI